MGGTEGFFARKAGDSGVGIVCVCVCGFFSEGLLWLEYLKSFDHADVEQLDGVTCGFASFTS